MDISEATVWEAHKAYIRGILFMAGSEKKKRTKKDKLALTKEISELVQQHKIMGDREVLLKLYGKREAMRNLVAQETRIVIKRKDKQQKRKIYRREQTG